MASTAAAAAVKPVLRIRRATPDDEAAVSKICLLTADAGKSAEHLHDYPELPGLVYAVPYVKLPTTWGFVLETVPTEPEKGAKVVGYVLGTVDTRAFEDIAARTWWPDLAKKYAFILEDSSQGKEVKSGDLHYAKLLQNMHTAPEANIAFSKAHLHIDILPEAQRMGWGTKLMKRAIVFLRDEAGGELETERLEGVWLGMDPRNVDARKFYEKLGFVVVPGAPDENQLCIKFTDVKF